IAYSMGGGLYGIIAKNIEVRKFGPRKFKGRAEIKGKVVTKEGTSVEDVEGKFKGGQRYKWKIFGEDGEVLMWGVESSHKLASRQIVMAHRAVYNIFHVAVISEPGFDYLSDKDRKWLAENKPGVSMTLMKILAASIGELRDVPSLVTTFPLISALPLNFRGPNFRTSIFLAMIP
ncbi:unnamed protein product, partial [marine sediment metagenome]